MRTYTQADRDQLLMALLDINLEQFTSVVNSNSQEFVEALKDDAVNTFAGQYFTQMTSGDPDAQLMFQAVASMSDATLHKVVQVFGTDPLKSGE